MGTRSRVAVMHGEVCKSVYCHYDGYLEYTGDILQKHFNSAEANRLVAMGDNSGVKETVEEMNFYADRDEDDVDFSVAHSFKEFLEQVDGCWAEWYYVMQDGVWYVGNTYERDERHYKKLVPLAESLELLAEEESV